MKHLFKVLVITFCLISSIRVMAKESREAEQEASIIYNQYLSSSVRGLNVSVMDCLDSDGSLALSFDSSLKSQCIYLEAQDEQSFQWISSILKLPSISTLSNAPVTLEVKLKKDNIWYNIVFRAPMGPTPGIIVRN